MREILFRGKRLDNGEWTLGSYSKQYGCHEILLESCEGEYGFDHYAVDPSTVGECTGLEDKNGKKIFEGDVVTGLFLFGMEIKAVVAFRDGAFGLQWNRGSVQEFSAFASLCNVKYEVVGNIHDSPELLKGESK